MDSFLVPFFLLLAAAGLTFVLWRAASHRHALPCPAWLGWMVELDNPFTSVNRAANIIAAAETRAGMRVLDAGCGPGRLTIPLAKVAGSAGAVTALDVQEGMLARVREKAEREGLTNIRYVRGGLGDGVLGHEEYDQAFLVTVLGEIPRAEDALRELHASLRSGGVLTVTEVIFDPHFTTQQSVLRLCTRAGFTPIQTLGRRYAYTSLFRKP